MKNVYLDEAAYRTLVAAILDQRHNPHCPESAVKMALGDAAIWPETIKPKRS